MTCTGSFFVFINFMILQTQDVAAGIRYDERRNYVLPPIFVYMEYVLLSTTLCIYKICNRNPVQFINISSLNTFAIFLLPFSILAAIHLFTRSVTKSQISTSPVKKLVAATSGVYMFIHISCIMPV